MKKTLFIFSIVLLNFSYSMQEKNLLARLPLEMQEHILRFIPGEFETQEESLQKLEKHQIGTEDQSLNGNNIGIYVDEKIEHLMLFNKKQNTLAN